MASNTIKTRIQLKNDTEVNWDKAINFVPLQGEIIIYSADESHPFSRIKIGNGLSTVSNLPFIGANFLQDNIQIGTTTELNHDLSYIPKKDQILIYLDKTTIDGAAIPGIKIGDGLAYCADLPFVGDDIVSQLLAHIADTVLHVSPEEREFWNNKLNCENQINNEVLTLNRL